MPDAALSSRLAPGIAGVLRETSGDGKLSRGRTGRPWSLRRAWVPALGGVLALTGCTHDGTAPVRPPPGAPLRILSSRTTDPAPSVIEIQANVFTPSAQEHVALNVDAERTFVVAWDSRRQQEGRCGVYLRRFDRSGRPLSDEIAAHAFAGVQRQPAVACGPDGAVWVAWESFGQDGDGWGVVLRRFDHGLAAASH